MKGKLFLIGSLFLVSGLSAQTADEAFIRKIADEVLINSKAYENLRTLTKTIGGRLAGSPQMYKAEDWGYNLLQQSGSQHTFKQECMVPHWVRGGKDQATALLPGRSKKELDILALGNSQGTGEKGVTAPVVLVNSFEELEQKRNNFV